MRKTNIAVRLILLIISIFSVFGFFIMRMGINEQEEKIKEVIHEIKEQKLRNQEYEAILDESNKDDLFRIIAEDELGYGRYDEIVYVDISGH